MSARPERSSLPWWVHFALGGASVLFLFSLFMLFRSVGGAGPGRRPEPAGARANPPAVEVGPGHAGAAAETPAAGPADRGPLTTAQIVARWEPFVAVIKGKASHGTGFLVRAGTIATTAHVIEDDFVSNLEVSFPAAAKDQQGPVHAELLYEDSGRDLAFLAVPSELGALDVAPSYKFVRGGDVTLIGNAGLGEGIVVENAVIRGTMSTTTVIEGLRYLQLNVAITPANSGSPVFDSTGRVIGVATRKSDRAEAVSFGIPIEDLHAALASLDSQRAAARARLDFPRRVAMAFRLLAAAGATYAIGLDARAGLAPFPREWALYYDKLSRTLEECQFAPADGQVAQFQADERMDANTRRAYQELSASHQTMRDLYKNPVGPAAKIQMHFTNPQWGNRFKERVLDVKANHVRLLRALSGRLKIEIPPAALAILEPRAGRKSRDELLVGIVPRRFLRLEPTPGSRDPNPRGAPAAPSEGNARNAEPRAGGTGEGARPAPPKGSVASLGAERAPQAPPVSKRLEIVTLKGHEGFVQCVAFHPDGKQLASGGHDRTVKLWDLATGKVINTLRGHTDFVTSVAFRPDGRQLASAGGSSVRLWDSQTGRGTRVIEAFGGMVYSVAFSPDGKRLAAGGGIVDGVVKVWDVGSGEEILVITVPTQVQSVAFAPDGKRIATGGWNGNLKVWDASTGRELLDLKGNRGHIQGVAFRPDGSRLAAGSDDGVKEWDAATGAEIGEPRVCGGRVAYSPDGKRLALASLAGTVMVWDTASGQATSVSLLGHAGHEATSLAFSPDGERLASASFDGTVKVWHVPRPIPEALMLTGSGGPVESVTFSPDGKKLATAGDGGILKVWDAGTGRETLSLRGHGGAVHGVVFSRDGDRLASAGADGTARVWNSETGQETLAFKGHAGAVLGVAFRGDGKQIASGGVDRVVRVWDAATGRETLALKGHTGPVSGVVFSPDGRWIASVGRDLKLKVWDAETGQETISVVPADIYGVAYSVDGKQLFTSDGAGWDAETGRRVSALTYYPPMIHAVRSLDGKRVAGVHQPAPSLIGVREVPNGPETQGIRGHEGRVLGLALSPDGGRLASTSDDGVVKIWEIHPLGLLPTGEVGVKSP